MPERVEIFIDGENLLTRFEVMSQDIGPGDCDHISGVVLSSWDMILIGGALPSRVSYYTAVVGDDAALESIRNQIAGIQYHVGTEPPFLAVVPKVFKKSKRSAKTKSVDINLTTDLLRSAYNDTADRFVVISGDGDYIPVYEEVMRQGKRVTVGALSSGLNPLIRSRVDLFVDLDPIFFP